MTAKPIAIGHASPVLTLMTDVAVPRIQNGRTRSNSVDTDAYLSPSSSSDASVSRASSAASRRPSFSRHTSLSPTARVSPHPIESFLDLAQTPGAADAALLKAALMRAAGKLQPQSAGLRPSLQPSRTASAHAQPNVSAPHKWYTDSANPIVAGLQLRQTITTRALGPQAHVSPMPGGMQLIHMIIPRCIDALVAQDLATYGQSRYAAMLKPDLRTNQLFKIRYNGKITPASDGFYACIIDQNDTLLVSVLSATTAGAPAGAHANLAGGLPVRFAGELRIAHGRVVWFNNASGHYRTPANLVTQALTQPLLVDAAVELIGF